MKSLNSKTTVLLMSFLLANCSQKKTEPSVSVQNPPQGAAAQVETAPLEEVRPAVVETTPAAAAGVQAGAPIFGENQALQSLPKQELKANLAEPIAPSVPEPASCLTFSFQHHAAPKHAIGPDCAHHKNRIALPQEILKGEHDLNQLCVRVDGVPVMSVREKDTLVLGAAPRSRSIISVRACRKGTRCQESCNVPKDELMEELAGDSDASENGWDTESALKVHGAVDETIKRELAALDDEEISKEWSLEGAPTEHLAASCHSNVKKTLTARKKN